jgi:mono/diheme cytochrome c family protein
MFAARAWGLGLSLAFCVGFGTPDARGEDPPAPDGRALFHLHCASCHGEKGDGRGTTVLDRPARSFQDGGFSFGNTPEALYRTITTGIPGTPMPGFESALLPAERRALAAHVLTLGPSTPPASPAAVIEVTDRAVVVRGMLPGLAPGEPPIPRGLLIGLPGGTSFEYRADDVTLRAVRYGGFVERRDWTGRGGVPLKPLGVPILRVPPSLASFELVSGGVHLRLRRVLAGTATPSKSASVSYRLVDEAGGRTLATAEEVPDGGLDHGQVELVRRIQLSNGDTRWRVRAGLGFAETARVLAEPPHAGSRGIEYGFTDGTTHVTLRASESPADPEAAEFVLEPRASLVLEWMMRAPLEIRGPDAAPGKSAGETPR